MIFHAYLPSDRDVEYCRGLSTKQKLAVKVLIGVVVALVVCSASVLPPVFVLVINKRHVQTESMIKRWK